MRVNMLLAGVFVGLIGTLQAQSTGLGSLKVFATPLPAHFSISEVIKGLELRLYLEGNDAKAVRVTPTSAGVSFTPSFVVFNSTVSAVSDITAEAKTSGDVTIDYVATLEGNSSESSVLFSQLVMVLPIPTAYSVDSKGWNGVVLQRDSFDNATTTLTSSFWSKQQHGYPSNACGSYDGSNSLFFTSLGDRLALTSPLELEGFHGKMHFYLVYGFETIQKYDSQGDNRVACEMTDINEEVRFGFLPVGADPRNVSSWEEILEIPLPAAQSSNFSSYSVILPQLSMHQTSQFYWMQKNHSSFPIDVVTGATRTEVIAAENDPTGVQGQLGAQERELWTYRNMFDQWALDNVQLEVRLNIPSFSLLPSGRLNSTTGVGIGGIDVLVASPVPGSWVEFTSGDGTQLFPVCNASSASGNANKATVSLSKSGYVHAVACLSVNSLLISSYPVRSSRFLVQAVEPTLSSVLDTSKSVDTWTLNVKCANCAFMRYIIVPFEEDNEASSFVPSCIFGTEIKATTGDIKATFNAKLRVVACGTDLLPSKLVESQDLVVHPRVPTFKYDIPVTTITGFMNLTIVPPSATNQLLGIAYSIVKADKDVPTCSSSPTSGEINLVVKVYDVVRAVTCCVGVVCADSSIASWGPVDVQAVKPTYTTVCSTIKPLTLIVELAAVTDSATVRYQISTSGTQTTLTCSSGTLYTNPVEVSAGAVKVVAVSCLDGLKMSDYAEVAIALDKCCSGRDAYTHGSCAHVLLMEDDFTKCPGDGGAGNVQTNTNWQSVTSQWGGNNVNGGVHADNVRCVTDSTLGKRVLELTANGDLFAGVAPVGKIMTSDGSLRDRTIDDRFTEWALDGITPLPCNSLEHCPTRRVGAAVKSVLRQNSGVMVMRMKPCSSFGTLTQVWWGNYEDVETSPEDEIPFLPLWKSALYQAKTSSDIPFTLTSPQTIDDTYTEIVMQWDASAARTNLYMDGQLVMKQIGTNSQSDSNSSLSIGVWFPNAAAGEPFFPTCHAYVDKIQVFDLQITGGRWCDFEDVIADTISCSEDADCEKWVELNCFMAIYEAVCTNDRTTDTDDGNSSSSSFSTVGFCQFRLQPMAQTSVSTTAMTTRELEMQWEEEEDPRRH
ncbi:hypothetical protein Pcac1_g21704 [Phytophthora cactorum]|uniref:GH16 domain-containing protein n=3 Tax=Phytophthora cactorum TaxID=29920 RepID=A0A329S248_9STRA|nr:hypothetical protein Pcac1_g21704 [Phytophthora cactorum]KAG2818238.1 hypothetical protein PC112_g12723 [Phytophthora cactorum]KAG3079017.1 hypothetical protein PC122_g12412 [Phytophthora cactorum]RAW29732.1 hypothetical protein PC110_g13898 [Phytophthora cactorum]